MAINTGGYDLGGVLPQYHPVDPSLAAFNPSQITHGIMDALQVGGTMQQMKAFKQHADEIAATEGIRTKLLQAESDQAAIKRDHALAVYQSEIDKQIAEAKRDAALAPKEGAAKGGALDTQVKLQPGVEQLAIGGQGLDISKLGALQQAQPFINTSLLEGAKQAATAAQFTGTQLPVKQAVESIRNNTALQTAPNESLIAVKSAEIALQSANLAYSKAVEDFKKGDTGAGELEKAKIISETAKANLDDAQAKYYAGRNQATTEIARLTAEKVDTHTKAYSALSQDYARSVAAFKNLIAEPAINPANPDDQRFTASKLVQAASVPNNPGFLKRIFGLGEAESIPAFVTDKIKEIQAARDELKSQEQVLGKIRAKIASSLVNTEATIPNESTAPTPTTAVVYWRNPSTGKIEPKP